jgi:hypothetical protein
MSKNNKYVLAVDLGQAQDFSGAALLEQTEDQGANIVNLKRFPIGTSYVDIVDWCENILQEPPLCGEHEPMAERYGGMATQEPHRLAWQVRPSPLVIDATGVGAPVVDMFRRRKIYPVAVWLTSGSNVNYDEDMKRYLVPKSEVICRLQVGVQNGKILVADELQFAEAFKRELQSMRYKITDSKNITFEHRSKDDGAHADLVLAACLGNWWLYGTKPAPTKKTVNLPPSLDRFRPGYGMHYRNRM